METYTIEEAIRDARYNKLPKWVKEELSQLNHRHRKSEEIVKSLCNDYNTNTYYQIPVELGSRANLPNNCIVEFTLQGGRDNTNSKIRVNIFNNTLRINSDSRIIVLPEATNAIVIKTID